MQNVIHLLVHFDLALNTYFAFLNLEQVLSAKGLSQQLPQNYETLSLLILEQVLHWNFLKQDLRPIFLNYYYDTIIYWNIFR